MLSRTLTLAVFASTALGHGFISSPPARQGGDASVAACGKAVVDTIRADNTSHVEGLPELAAKKDSGFHADLCNLWLCKGLQFADNAANVQAYRPGQSVNMKIKLTIPHTGNANVSVVDTKSNTIVGKPLVRWDKGYADERDFYAKKTPKDQVDFNVTIPEDLGDKCATAGACVSDNAHSVAASAVVSNLGFVPTMYRYADQDTSPRSQVLQWWWYGTGARQSYETCVDFTVAASS